MAFTARITFTDLCAFFRPSSSEVDVVLVDARTPTPDQEAAGMHRHEPVLCVATRHLSPEPGNREPNRLVPEFGGDALAVFDLAREEVSISTPSPFDAVTYPITTNSPLSRFEESSLSWLAPLGLLGFTPATLAPAVFGNLSTGTVASRIKITGGRITCSRIISADGQYRHFDLRSAPQAPRVGENRAFGDLVRVELTLPSIQENNGPQFTSSSGQHLSIATPSDDSTVDILIGNMTLDPSLLFLEENVATHFRWFYELLQDPPLLMERVIPFGSALGALTATSPRACLMGIDI